MKDIMNKTVGWITSQKFSLDELYDLRDKLEIAINRIRIYPHPVEELQKQEEQETTMTNFSSERWALRDQLDHRYSTKNRKALQEFGISDDDHPRTGTETVQRIKDGMYIIEKDRWHDGGDRIRWRDPAKTEDWTGYNAVKDKLDEEFSALASAMLILDPKDALARLEAW